MLKKRSAKDWFAEGYQYDVIQLNPQKAIEAYKESIKLDDRLTDAYVNLGFIYLQNEDYEEALRCFQRVVQLETHNPEAYNNLGYVYEKMKRLGSARQMYEKALALNRGILKQ
jgi:Flp pilus assembly protein TadD